MYQHSLYRPHSVPDRLPPPESAAWVELVREMLPHFQRLHRHLRPPIAWRQVLIIHPAQAQLLEQARAIFNGDVEAGLDEEGRSYALPRVWRWEHHLRVFWTIELPAHLNARSILLWSGDREPGLN